jgi:hypothetical protein
MLHQIRAFAFAVTFGVYPATIQAETVLGELMAITKACGQDVQNLCSSAAPGGGRAIRCLGSNIMNVSEPCRKTMEMAMNDLCGADLARLCPGHSVDDPSSVNCLHEHRSELRGSCKAASDRVNQKN